MPGFPLGEQPVKPPADEPFALHDILNTMTALRRTTPPESLPVLVATKPARDEDPWRRRRPPV
jgi:hypothetical protein